MGKGGKVCAKALGCSAHSAVMVSDSGASPLFQNKANHAARLWGKMGHSCWAGYEIRSPHRRGAGSRTPNSQATGPGQQRRKSPTYSLLPRTWVPPFIHNLVSTRRGGSFRPHSCRGTPHGPKKRQSSDSFSDRGTPKDTVSSSRARHKGPHNLGFMTGNVQSWEVDSWVPGAGRLRWEVSK